MTYRIQKYGDKGWWRVVTGRGLHYRIVSCHPTKAEAEAEASRLNHSN